MKFLIGLAIVSVLFAIYVVWGRPWMRKAPWAQPFFAWIEPIEVALWWKSETVLKARAKMLLGLVLTLLTQIGTLDITPLMPLVPDQYEPMVTFAFNLLPMILTLGGWVDEKLRKDTTKPLEVVALPDAVVAASPALQNIVAKAEEVKADAVSMAPEVKAAEAEVAKAA
jgi:Na+/proline symporter